ncbi:phage minor structural protein%2C N-terminal region [uncultured Clostridium sp.]|nr:phage minor structural protein%2C N-terminal region [uncultured Clostridium sp.]
MIHLKGKNKKKIAGLVDYKDLFIEKILESGDQLLSFSYSKKSKYYFDIVEEGYITTKENEYVIKEKNVGSDYTEFKCVLNLEDLEGRPFERYESVEQPIDKALALALAGTGWIVGKCSLKKKRTVRATNCSSLEIIKNIRKTYRCDLVFNTLTRTIDVYERLGEDKGTYFIDSLNLKELSIQGNSYDYYTRIIPIGKDDLRISNINNGKEYVENYQYSNKVKTIYWKDDRYTIVENLKEDAEAKLDEISKPYRAYAANIINLAKLNDKYKNILDYKLGDTITLISKDNKFRDKQRIVKIKEYPDEHELDSVEIANTTLSFEEIQTQFQEAVDTVDNITTDNGTVDGSKIDSIKTEQISDFETSVAKITDLTVVNAKIENLEAQNVSITGKLTAVEATIGTLTSNVASIDRLVVNHSAYINDLQANKASITQVEAVNATIQVLEANVGKIETLVNGNLSSENIQAGGITSDKLTIANGFIKNAMIDSLDVAKINAGDISTNKFRITSDSGNMLISDNTIQIRDTNRVRVQIGKDASNDYNMYVWDSNGNLMFDATGLKEGGIKDKIIRDDMISDNANIDGHKLNINSVVTQINNGSTTIKSSKVQIDGANQTLDVAFNQLKTQADETTTTTESNSTTIGVMQGQISTAINNTQIIKDGQTILLKDDYNRTVATVDSMKSTIGSHTTQINTATGKINNVETKVNTVERDLNSITARVSSTETNITTIRDTANTALNKVDNVQTEITKTNNKVASIETNLSSITSRVSTVETTTVSINGKVNNLSTRMNSAEEKITDSAIIQTVSSQFYNKDQSNNIYTNKTEFEQTANKLTLLATSNKTNIIVNSNGDFGVDSWTIDGLEVRTKISHPNEILEGFQIINGLNSERFMYSSFFKLEPNTTYTFQINCNMVQGSVLNGFDVHVIGNNNDLYSIIENRRLGFHKVEFTTKGSVNEKYRIRIDHNGSSQYVGSVIGIDSIYMVKGRYQAVLDWKPSTADTSYLAISSNKIEAKVTSLNSRLGSAESTITQQANEIRSKVDANGAISIVTQRAGQIISDFSRTGEVMIKNGNFSIANRAGERMLWTDGGKIGVSAIDIYGDNDGTLTVRGNGNKGIDIRSNNDGTAYIDLAKNASDDYHMRIQLTRNHLDLLGQFIAPQFEFIGRDGWITYFNIHGNLAVSGSKSRMVQTKSFGRRCLNAVESADCLFTDSGESKTINNKSIIFIDPIFKETVNTNIPYQVFLTKYSKGEIWVSERYPDYFVVESDTEMSFSWKIEAKQLGFESTRLQIQ